MDSDEQSLENAKELQKMYDMKFSDGGLSASDCGDLGCSSSGGELHTQLQDEADTSTVRSLAFLRPRS